MNYVPNIWSENNLVTAAKMNHIERGMQNLGNLLAEPIILAIPIEVWSENPPYTYIIENENIFESQLINVSFDQSIKYLTSDLIINTMDGGLKFTTNTLPTNALNITIFLYNLNQD